MKCYFMLATHKNLGIVQNMNWTGQLGWTIGLDSWTGQLDWTVGLDYWTGILFYFAICTMGLFENRGLIFASDSSAKM